MGGRATADKALLGRGSGRAEPTIEGAAHQSGDTARISVFDAEWPGGPGGPVPSPRTHRVVRRLALWQEGRPRHVEGARRASPSTERAEEAENRRPRIRSGMEPRLMREAIRAKGRPSCPAEEVSHIGDRGRRQLPGGAGVRNTRTKASASRVSHGRSSKRGAQWSRKTSAGERGSGAQSPAEVDSAGSTVASQVR